MGSIYIRIAGLLLVLAGVGILSERIVAGETSSAGELCAHDADCDDRLACTQDICSDGECKNSPIVGCVPCGVGELCPPLNVVFIMDTSGSMSDEVAALCNNIDDVVTLLAGKGITVIPAFLGITEIPTGFECLTDTVLNLFGSNVPGNLTNCPFPNGSAAYETWGPATAIVADEFPWTVGAVRVIIPITDEGPCNGSRPEGCEDPGPDRDSITNAIAVCDANEVFVSPIIGTGSDSCVTTLATALADGTGGIVFQSQAPASDLAEAIARTLFDACVKTDQCDDLNACTKDDFCVGGACVGTAIPECRVCQADSDCKDENSCTIDRCKDDRCENIDIDTLACTGDFDCFGAVCNTVTGLCDCDRIPQLCLEPEPGLLIEEGCYQVGEEITINVELGLGDESIVGAQMHISYPPSSLQFVSISPGSFTFQESPFSAELFETVDSTLGRIFYAVGVAIGSPGTPGPAVLATLRMRVIAPCTTADLCFLHDNPKKSILTNNKGQFVPFIPCCIEDLTLSGGPPQFICPLSVQTNADPGGISATIAWPGVVADDLCNEEVEVSCKAKNSSGIDIDYLISGGGRFPAGHSEFECTATPICGPQSKCQWSVDVTTANSAEVDVQLSPTMASGPLRRCVEFEFFANCIETPVIVQTTIDFGPPFNLPGRADGVFMNIPAGDYACATARDPLHTLRGVANMQIVGTRWKANFENDPYFGGNWLMGGNLDSNRVIDVYDVAVYTSQYLQSLPKDTPCGAAIGHADINGDGKVDQLDFAILDHNYLEEDRDSCCPTNTSSLSEPVSQVSVAQLIQEGKADLIEADLNGDGWVNGEDMLLLKNGEVARRKVRAQIHTSHDAKP